MNSTTSPSSLVASMHRSWQRRRRHADLICWVDPALVGVDADELRYLIGHADREVYAPIVTALATAAASGDNDAATVLTLGIIDTLISRTRDVNVAYFDELLGSLWSAAVSCVNPGSRYARETIARNARHQYLLSRRAETASGAPLHDFVADNPPDCSRRPVVPSVEDQALTACQLNVLLDDLAATDQISCDTRALLLAAADGQLEPLPAEQHGDRKRRRRQLNSARTSHAHDVLVA